jgi:LysM repeat protein/DNA-directed RNA polymerase specialized sigma24 family protein
MRFDRDPELSPDLVWLLQSQQVEDGLLARLLAQEGYAQLQPFWEALLGDPQAARLAIRETLSSALIKANTFREAQPIRSWLTSLAIEVYRKDNQKRKHRRKPTYNKGLRLGRLSASSRLAVVLRFRLDYPVDDVAGFLGENLFSTKMRLWHARRLLLKRTSYIDPPDKRYAEADWLAQTLQRAFPAPALSEVELEALSQEVIENVQNKRRRLHRAAYWKELSLIGAVILAALAWMARANLGAPEATPRPPAGQAFAGGTLRPSRQPSATSISSPTRTASARISTLIPVPTQSSPTPVPEDAFYTVQEGDTLLKIAAVLGTSAEALRSLNRLPEGANLYPGEKLLKPGSLQINTPIPYAEFSRSRPTPSPSAAPLTPDEILRSLNSFYFNSFWVDLQYIYRGPEGYRGEAQTYRLQWWETPSGAVILDGRNPNMPDEAIKWWRWSTNEYYVARLAYGSPWFRRVDYSGVISQLIEPLNFVFNLHTEYWNDQWVNTEVVGSGQVGNRPVYILRQFNSQQQLVRTLWIDQASSLPLHIQVYDPHNPQHITTEMLVTGLEINPDIPTAFFNPQMPWLGGYAKDSHGDPFSTRENLSPWGILSLTEIRKPYTSATPKNLNLATSALQFQYSQLSPMFPSPKSQSRSITEIFAGDKYLGLAALPNPFLTLCARSPDGRRIAYSTASTNTLDIFSGEASPGSPIRWIDLWIPSMENLTGLQPFSFVFSQDGKQLAVFGDRLNANRGIYLLDLQSGEERFLQAANLAYSLAWRPDGKQLAYISQPAGPSSIASLVVVDVESGEVVSRQSFPAPGDSLTQIVRTWPHIQWGVRFPVGMGDLGACAASPAGK